MAAAAKLRNRQSDKPIISTAQERELDPPQRLSGCEQVLTRDQLLDLLEFTATKHLSSL